MKKKYLFIVLSILHCAILLAQAPSSVKAVDLGLPSGTLWANMNVGAQNPDEVGDYFAWGEISSKPDFTWETSIYYHNDLLSKYVTRQDLWYGDGFCDKLTQLEAVDDAATQLWGSDWRLPTKAEVFELIEYCSLTKSEDNAFAIITGPNGNSIKVPYAGYMSGKTVERYGKDAEFWTSTIGENPFKAYLLAIEGWNWTNEEKDFRCDYRKYGHTLRPVTTSVSAITTITNECTSAVYNLSGIKSDIGDLFIIRDSKGCTKKIFKKR